MKQITKLHHTGQIALVVMAIIIAICGTIWAASILFILALYWNSIVLIQQYDKTRYTWPKLTNPRLAAALHKKEPFVPQPGVNFHLNGIQFEIKNIVWRYDNPDRVIRIDVVSNQPHTPRVEVKLAWPSLMPWGGEEFDTNVVNLERLYQVDRQVKSDAINFKKAVPLCPECGCNSAFGDDCLLSNCPKSANNE